jgi:hypothetical protein
MTPREWVHNHLRPLLAAIAITALGIGVLVAPSSNGETTGDAAVQAASPGGHTFCTVDVSGYCTITHGLGGKPAGVVVTSDRIGQLGTTDTFTATTFRVRWWWHTGGLFAAGTRIDFSWVPAGGSLPETTTPPPVTTPPATTPPVSTPPATTPTAPAAACTSPVYTTTARENNGSGGFSNGGFVVHNNEWNDEHGPQTLSACSYKSWFVTSDQPGAGNDDSVKTYPGTQKLVDIPMSALGNISSSFSVATPAGSGTIPTASSKGKQWNAAYDIWLDDFGTEVMIWNDWTMNWRFWYGQYGGHQATIDGVLYNAYHNGDAMWFVRATPVKSGTVDVDNVLKYAQSQGWLTASQRVNAIEYGFEIAYTGAPTRFDLLDYSLTTS